MLGFRSFTMMSAMAAVQTVSSVYVHRRWNISKSFGPPRLPSNRDPAMSPTTAPHIGLPPCLSSSCPSVWQIWLFPGFRVPPTNWGARGVRDAHAREGVVDPILAVAYDRLRATRCGPYTGTGGRSSQGRRQKLRLFRVNGARRGPGPLTGGQGLPQRGTPGYDGLTQDRPATPVGSPAEFNSPRAARGRSPGLANTQMGARTRRPRTDAAKNEHPRGPVHGSVVPAACTERPTESTQCVAAATAVT